MEKLNLQFGNFTQAAYEIVRLTNLKWKLLEGDEYPVQQGILFFVTMEKDENARPAGRPLGSKKVENDE